MRGVKEYFKEVLKTLKSIDESLKELSKCVSTAPSHGHGYVIRTSHWND